MPSGIDVNVWLHSEDHQAVDLHSQRSVFQIAQRANQQPSAHQQHHAQRHLQSDNDSAGARFARVGIGCRRGSLQRQLRSAGKRHTQRREAKQQRGKHQHCPA